MKINLKLGVLALIVIAFSVILFSCAPPITDEKVSVPALVHPGLPSDMGCVDCHMDVTPTIVNQWQNSGHGKLNYGCYMCHGDGVVKFTPKPSDDGCSSCHSGSAAHIEKYNHMSCFDCHNGHSLIVG